MKTKILVDSIMRQTTVLIAQLTASAGIRAPVSRLADEVFLNLSDELENQGVPRKVVADMFGMALRGYQRRVQRLRESSTEANTTLWEAVLGYIEAEGPLRREEVLQRFNREDPDALRSMLRDLIASGLVLRQGSGRDVHLLALQEEHRRALAKKGSRELVESMVWLDLSDHPGTTSQEIAERMSLESDVVTQALGSLRKEGRLREENGAFRAESLTIPVGAESGWETAVFDHFQTVCAALIAKLRRGQTRARGDDTTGGLTVTFDVYDGHPEQERVLALLQDVVTRIDEVWDAVEDYNRDNPVPAERLRPVTFYAGQFQRDAEEEDDA